MPWTRLEPNAIADALWLEYEPGNKADEAAAAQAHQTYHYPRLPAARPSRPPGGISHDATCWLAEGKLKYRKDVTVGLKHAPTAFADLLVGGNFGKAIVDLL